MDKPKVRWGIIGAANIAKKNWQGIWNSKNGVVTAVASRDPERGRRFVAECQSQAPFDLRPRVTASYEELIAAPDINAVYIPLPTRLRKEWVIRAANAGKHVVCEKPCAVTVADLDEMIDACRCNRVQFMDGVMFMHSLRLERIHQILEEGEPVGKVRRFASAFTFNAPDEFFTSNIRVHSELEPHGCLGDLGWYCIRFVLWALDWKLPLSVTGRTLSELRHQNSQASVPTEFSGELFFDGGVSASFYCSFTTELSQWVEISGTRGSLRVSDFVLPFAGNKMLFETSNPVFEVQGCDFKMEPHIRRWAVNENSHSHATAQESNLFRHFAEQIQSGTLNNSWPAMARKTQHVMQACRDSSLADSRPIELRS